MIRFEIGGRRIDPNRIGDALTAVVLEGIREEIRKKVGTIRDPQSGEFPTVVVRGNDLDNLKLHVEGSPEIIALVKERLGIGENGEEQELAEPEKTPRVFLSYTADDSELARRIAEALQANGIDTWWDKWCISAGDSLRRKIDEGLSGCTHFLVLLTPQSIGKPWANQEMDAGLVRKLKNECRFLPVRYNLPASALPPLLAGMHATEVTTEEDIAQLIGDIHGVSRKPPLGPAPHAIAQAAATETSYSPAATAIARMFVERTQHGNFADPQIDVEEIAQKTGLSVPDVKDGLYELSAFFRDNPRHVLVEASLFTEFDKHWQPWDPVEDALRLAADIANDSDFPAMCQEIAERYGWEARRLNPAVTYLFERDMLADYRVLGAGPFVMAHALGKEDAIRRFLKSRR